MPIELMADAGAASARIVLLPAAYTRAGDFAGAGFAEAVRERRLAIDLVAADLEFSSVTDRSMLERLRSGPLHDARAAGCASVWLAGVSLGGFVALAFAERYPGEVDGLCLIAPYLGTRIVTREIGEAGGLARWQPGPAADGDEERRIWRFIQSGREQRPALYLGYGREDRFADSQRLLGDALPPASVDVVDGGHDWPAWRQVWARFLDRWAAAGGHPASRPRTGDADVMPE